MKADYKDLLQWLDADCACCYDKMMCKICRVTTVRELVAKQTPKKPVMKNSEFGYPLALELYHCPTCGEVLTQDYCECGQLIDWSSND